METLLIRVLRREIESRPIRMEGTGVAATATVIVAAATIIDPREAVKSLPQSLHHQDSMMARVGNTKDRTS